MSSKTKILIGTGVLGAFLLGAGTYYVSTHTNPWVDTGVFAYSGKTVNQIENQLIEDVASSPVTVSSGDIESKTTLGEFGVTVKNSHALAEQIVDHYVFWKVTNWGETFVYEPEVAVSETKVMDFVEKTKLGSSPVNAEIVYNEGAYHVTAGLDGVHLSEQTATQYVQNVFNSGTENIITLESTAPELTTATAEEQTSWLNANISGVKYDLGGEEWTPTWGEVYTVTPDGDHFAVSVDKEKIVTIVNELPGKVNREGSERHTITDSVGNVLWVTKEGASHRELKEPAEEIVKKTVEELLTPDVVVIPLNVSIVEIPDVPTSRRIEVDISDQRVKLYENEQVVADWAVSTGLPGNDTDEGSFKVRAFVRIQDMGGEAAGYLQPDVPWVVYYNGDEAFHGAYWHNQFGQKRSHGCVNLPVEQAKQLYEFAYLGMEVNVHE